MDSDWEALKAGACPQCGWAAGFHDRAVHEQPLNIPDDWTLLVAVSHGNQSRARFVDGDGREHYVTAYGEGKTTPEDDAIMRDLLDPPLMRKPTLEETQRWAKQQAINAALEANP